MCALTFFLFVYLFCFSLVSFFFVVSYSVDYCAFGLAMQREAEREVEQSRRQQEGH
jgi:hypothetical protein